MTLYEREFDSARACEQHARFVPMPDAEEEEWTKTILGELGPDSDVASSARKKSPGNSSAYSDPNEMA